MPDSTQIVPSGNSDLLAMFRISAGATVGVTLLVGPLLAQPVAAQDSVLQRLSSDRLGHVDCGSYVAGDRIGFTVGAAGPDYLLRLEASPEVFVLHSDNAAMGGKVLRYDSGETALQVSGWGGITLYTDSEPVGLPAVRTGEATVPPPPDVSITELEDAAQDNTEHLAHAQRLDVEFSADWSGLAADAGARALALNAMENVARGLGRFGRSPQSRDMLARRVNLVMFAVAGRPTVTLVGKMLTVTFDPRQGYEGRASSRAIARALSGLLPKSQKQS